MPKAESASSFVKIIKSFHKDRQFHTAAIAEIDAILVELGILAEPDAVVPPVVAPRRGRPKGSTNKAPKKRRKRGDFNETASELVLGLLAGKTLTTAQINTAWHEAGRSGLASNTLSKLTKEKKIVATKVKDGRGSSYSVA